MKRYTLMPAGMVVLCSIFLMLVYLRTAQAMPVTFEFGGDIVDVLTNDSPDGAVGTFFNPGDTISGSFTFESSSTSPYAPPLDFIYAAAVTSLSFSVNGSYNGSASSGDIEINDYAGPTPAEDIYSVRADAVDGLTAPSIGANSLSFFNLSVFGSFLSDTTLLLTPPPLSVADNWGSNSDRIELLYSNADGVPSGVLFQPTFLQRVPEPSTMLLLGSALTVLGLVRRKLKV